MVNGFMLFAYKCFKMCLLCLCCEVVLNYKRKDMPKSCGTHNSAFVCGLSGTATLVIFYLLLASIGERIVKIYCMRGVYNW